MRSRNTRAGPPRLDREAFAVAMAYGAVHAEAAIAAGSTAAKRSVLKTVGRHLGYEPAVRARIRALVAERDAHEARDKSGRRWEPKAPRGVDRPAAGLLTDAANGIVHLPPRVDLPVGPGGGRAEQASHAAGALARAREEAERLYGASAPRINWWLVEPRFLAGGRPNPAWDKAPSTWQA